MKYIKINMVDITLNIFKRGNAGCRHLKFWPSLPSCLLERLPFAHNLTTIPYEYFQSFKSLTVLLLKYIFIMCILISDIWHEIRIFMKFFTSWLAICLPLTELASDFQKYFLDMLNSQVWVCFTCCFELQFCPYLSICSCR